MNSATKYSHTIEIHNLSAPGEIVPYLIDTFKPSSVIDVGCGWGTFLKVFYNHGVTDITGVDGTWVKRDELLFPKKNFIERDLESKIDLDRKYDIALCLEVAEHIYNADVLVSSLATLSDIIIFSAALRNQGGQNHINEQPASYWQQKFAACGFVFYDVFRDRFWNNEKVDWWYAQNMFLVVRNTMDISAFDLTVDKAERINEYIHPQLFDKYIRKRKKAEKQLNDILSGKASIQAYFKLMKQAISYRLFKK